jgi:hypothetical protein
MLAMTGQAEGVPAVAAAQQSVLSGAAKTVFSVSASQQNRIMRRVRHGVMSLGNTVAASMAAVPATLFFKPHAAAWASTADDRKNR